MLWQNIYTQYIQNPLHHFQASTQWHSSWILKKKFFNNYLSHKVCFEGVQLGDLQVISQQILSFSIKNNNKVELKESELNKNRKKNVYKKTLTLILDIQIKKNERKISKLCEVLSY